MFVLNDGNEGVRYDSTKRKRNDTKGEEEGSTVGPAVKDVFKTSTVKTPGKETWFVLEGRFRARGTPALYRRTELPAQGPLGTCFGGGTDGGRNVLGQSRVN